MPLLLSNLQVQYCQYLQQRMATVQCSGCRQCCQIYRYSIVSIYSREWQQYSALVAASVAKSIGIVFPVFIVENGNSIVLWLPNLQVKYFQYLQQRMATMQSSECRYCCQIYRYSIVSIYSREWQQCSALDAASVAKSIGIVLSVFIVENGNNVGRALVAASDVKSIGNIFPIFKVKNGISIVSLHGCCQYCQ